MGHSRAGVRLNERRKRADTHRKLTKKRLAEKARTDALILTRVTPEEFGKDHWSLLGYIWTRCTDSFNGQGIGEIDKRKVRCNTERHGIHAVNGFRWKPEYGTRLKGYFLEGDNRNPERRLDTHDDWDCLYDFEECGYVEVFSEINGFVKLTELGLDVAARLMKHKASGGNFADFSLVGKG